MVQDDHKYIKHKELRKNTPRFYRGSDNHLLLFLNHRLRVLLTLPWSTSYVRPNPYTIFIIGQILKHFSIFF
jgi:hypothetical protein